MSSTSKRARAALAVIAGVVLGLVVIVPASAAPQPLLGFNDAADSFARHPDQAAVAGARIARLPVSWEQTEPSPGEHDWSEIDPAVTALRDRGVRVLFALGAAPEWASADCVPDFFRPTCGPGPGYEGDYQRFALALLDRYPGSRIQAWNEPNLPLFGNLLPKRAAELTNALYAVAPDAVIGPAASPAGGGQLRYTRQLYRKVNRHVPLGVNFYPRSVVSSGNLADDWPDVRRIADHRQVWVTEIGFSSSEYGRGGQATRTANAYRFLASQGAHAIIFHRLLDVPVEDSRWLSSLGLLDRYGNPKPAFRALRQAVLDGAHVSS